MNKSRILDWLLIVGLLVLLAMALLPLLNINQEWMRWVYVGGAAVVLVVRLMQRYKGKNLRVKRLYRINVMSAVLYCASAAMLFYSKGTQDWIAFLMAGAALQTYASYMIDHELKKEPNSVEK